MTLSTNIYIHDPVEPKALFEMCQCLLALQDNQRRLPRDQRTWNDERTYGNHIEQGLPAILTVYHNNGNYILPDEDVESEWAAPPHYVRVNFDTSYGFNQPPFASASDLHCWLINELGNRLNERNKEFSWRNEFTGQVHRGFSGLGGFGNLYPNQSPPIRFENLDSNEDTQEEETV